MKVGARMRRVLPGGFLFLHLYLIHTFSQVPSVCLLKSPWPVLNTVPRTPPRLEREKRMGNIWYLNVVSVMHGIALMKLYPQSNIKLLLSRLHMRLGELAAPTH